MHHAHKVRAAAAVAALALCTSAFAEIEKIATMGDRGIRFVWWPKVAVPPGWHHERDQSMQNGLNALVPDGFNFANAESVIYARALYKPREPDLKTLQALMEHDRRNFVSKDPTLIAKDAEPITSADGKVMKAVTFHPKGKGNWEQVTYGEEGEFYLLFVLSSRTRAGYDSSLKVYREMLGRYKE